MRDNSITFRRAVYSPRTKEVYTLLTTFEHSTLSAPIRISSDNKDTFEVLGIQTRGTVSRGNNYVFTPLDIILPDDVEGTISQAQLSIDNVAREIMDEIRNMADSPVITMEVVLASSPDSLEAVYSGFELVDVNANAIVITGTITLGNFLSEPYPGGTILPSNFQAYY